MKSAADSRRRCYNMQEVNVPPTTVNIRYDRSDPHAIRMKDGSREPADNWLRKINTYIAHLVKPATQYLGTEKPVK